MNLKKVLMVILPFILIAVFLVGIIGFDYSDAERLTKTDQQKTEEAVKDCEKYSDLDSRRGCFIIAAYQTNKPELCNRIGRWDYEFLCISSVAQMKGNIGICDLINKSEEHQFCIAMAKKNKEDCNLITNISLQGGCKYSIEVTTKK